MVAPRLQSRAGGTTSTWGTPRVPRPHPCPGEDIGHFCFFPAEGGEGRSKPAATALMLGKTPRNRMRKGTRPPSSEPPEEWGALSTLG